MTSSESLRPLEPETLNFSYDGLTDILTVEGLKYSGNLFRSLGYAFQRGELFTIIERQDGVLTIRKVLLEPEK